MTSEQRKKHVCQWPECGRSFSRSDHLQRHMLNHSSEGRTCPRCRAHFKRPDLLDRHMMRHKQRDEEAGGEGLGVIETRKRMWRDIDGNIVSQRPSLPNQAQRTSAQVSQEQSPSNRSSQPAPEVQAPPSQPGNEVLPESSEQSAQYRIEVLPGEEWQQSNFIPPTRQGDQAGADMFDFLANSTWGQNQSQTTTGTSNGSDARMFEDVFNPDTASSFNMPFTTMNNYNWLFDTNSAASAEAQLNSQMDHSVAPITNDALNLFNQITNASYASQSGSFPARQPIPTSFYQSTNLTLPLQSFLAQPDYQHRGSVEEAASAHAAEANRSHLSDAPSAASTSPEAFSTDDYSIASSRTSASLHMMPPRKVADQAQQRSCSTSFTESTFMQTIRFCGEPRILPQVGEEARERVLDLIVQARAYTPDGKLVARDHALLSLQALQNYSDLFFSRFNATYPLIHKATFDPSKTETLFLISILLLGATYSDKDAHRLAVCIHDIMRPQLFQHEAFTATPKLWMLQTILLVECFGKSRAGQKQHDMSHLFHGLLINLIRRSDCQTVQQPDFSHSTLDLDMQWRMAMDVEQRKRLAFLCFMWDTQHAVLFSQSLCMSAFELRTSLPCNPAAWEAETAGEWQQHNSREPKPKLFLPVLKSYMSLSTPTQSNNLNALSRLLILHGLMSISWDMNRRDQTSLGCASLIGTDGWRARIGASYDAWKADFDTYCMNISSSMIQSQARNNPDIRSDFQRFITSTLAIYHAAHIILNVEILDLQIYAGARHIIGRPVSSVDKERSTRKIRDWIQQKPGSSPACVAAWHAASLLRDGVMNLTNWDVNNAFHYPWCLYLATLTCWAFHFCSQDEGPSRSAGAGHIRNSASEDMISISMGIYPDDDTMWDAKADMNALVSSMTSGVPEGLSKMAGKYSTKGLTTVMAQHLSNVRWAVVHEGMKVLRGLV